MSATRDQQSPEAADVLAEDHSEVDRLIHEVLASVDVGNKATSFQRLDQLWARLAVHIRAEHLCLFPSILDVPGAIFADRDGAPQFEEAQVAISQLRHDHDFFMRELATAVNSMREHKGVSDTDLTRSLLEEVRRIVESVKTRLDAHNQLEENQVYQWADVLLGASERVALTMRMQRELENMPPRFNGI